MDRYHVGRLLKQLEQDGLADDAIVLCSDHSCGLLRHKGSLCDSGLRVPLLIRFRKRYRHLAPAAPGQLVDQLVSFVDFGPTVLSLCGVQVPDYMHGRPFLEPQAAPTRKQLEYSYGAREPVYEAIDLSRPVPVGWFLYIRIRKYMPRLPSISRPAGWTRASSGVSRRVTSRSTAQGLRPHSSATSAYTGCPSDGDMLMFINWALQGFSQAEGTSARQD